MKFYHGIPDRTDFLKVCPNALSLIVSAYRVKCFKNIKKHLPLAREIFLDSGMISAWNAGKIEWKDNQNFVLDLGREIGADVIASLDLPVEPAKLEKNGFSVKQALEITLENAKRFMDAKTHAIKVFTVQGVTIYDYAQSLRDLIRIGVLNLDPKETWIAIGSIRNKSPKQGLYDVARLVCGAAKASGYHVHAFGVGRRERITALHDIGVDSFDCATASIRVGVNKGIYQVKGKRENHHLPSQFASEMMLFETNAKTPYNQGVLWK